MWEVHYDLTEYPQKRGKINHRTRRSGRCCTGLRRDPAQHPGGEDVDEHGAEDEQHQDEFVLSGVKAARSLRGHASGDAEHDEIEQDRSDHERRLVTIAG